MHGLCSERARSSALVWIAGTVCFVGFSACGPVLRPPPYATIHNGGLHSSVAHCGELAFRISDQKTDVWSKDGPGCKKGAVRTIRATSSFVHWRVAGSARLAGPQPSNRIKIDLLPLILSGSSETSLDARQRDKSLQHGASEKSVAAGNRSRSLEHGASSRKLVGTMSDRRLLHGQSEMRLAQERAERNLVAGKRDKPVLSIVKTTPQPSLFEGGASFFTLRVQNIGPTNIVRLVLFDRVDRRLEVTAVEGGAVYRLEDKTVLAVWDTREVLAPREWRSFRIRFRVRQQSK